MQEPGGGRTPVEVPANAWFRCERGQLGITALLPNGISCPPRRHDQFRVQSWSGFYGILRDHLGTWASYEQARRSSHETFRPAPRRMLDAHLNRRLVVVAQTVRAGGAAASVVGSAVGRFERRGEASAACHGSATESISLLWRPWSPAGCAVRGRSSGPPEPGMNRRRRWETRERDGRTPQQQGCAGGARWRR